MISGTFRLDDSQRFSTRALRRDADAESDGVVGACAAACAANCAIVSAARCASASACMCAARSAVLRRGSRLCRCWPAMPIWSTWSATRAALSSATAARGCQPFDRLVVGTLLGLGLSACSVVTPKIWGPRTWRVESATLVAPSIRYGVPPSSAEAPACAAVGRQCLFGLRGARHGRRCRQPRQHEAVSRLTDSWNQKERAFCLDGPHYDVSHL